MLTYVCVRSGVAIRAKLQESRLKERLSICLRAVAPFPHKACSLCPPPPKILSAGTPHCAALRGPRQRSSFAFCIQMATFSELAFERASPGTMSLFRRRNYAPLSLVAIRAVSSPCAALRRSARLSRGCSSSRRENAETFASLLVPTELSPSSLIFTPRGYKRTRAPHRRYSDRCALRRSRHSSAPGSPGENL